MTEQEFITKLDHALRGVPADQKKDILDEYRSHFFEAREHGKTEEEISRGLGEPKVLARSYLADYHFNRWTEPAEDQSLGRSVYHLARGLIVIFSLLFFNAFFMLWPVLVLAVVLASLWFAVVLTTLIAFIVAVVSIIGVGFVQNTFSHFAAFFYAMGTGLLAVLGGIALYYISRWFIFGLQRYIKLNINLVQTT